MPDALIIAGFIIACLYGAIIGSFLNVCIYRLPRNESLLMPPSHCPQCNTRLRPRDLVPVFSYLLLGRKCRYCHTAISPRYAIIETITALLFGGAWWALVTQFGMDLWSPSGLVLLIAVWTFLAAMLVTFQIDLETTYVIEPVTWIAMAAGIVFEIARGALSPAYWVTGTNVAFQFGTKIGDTVIPYLPQAVPGMIIGFLVFILMNFFGSVIFRKPAMGLGDAFIGAAIGAMLGPITALLSFGVAIFAGAIIGVILLIVGTVRQRQAPGSEELPPAAVPRPQRDNKKKRKHGQPAPAPVAMEELPAEAEPTGFYMPFGPFLTASAALFVLYPSAGNAILGFFHWWFSPANPMFN